MWQAGRRIFYEKEDCSSPQRLQHDLDLNDCGVSNSVILFLAQFFGHLNLVRRNGERFHDFLLELGRKYGEDGLFYLSLPNSPLTLYLTDPKLVVCI